MPQKNKISNKTEDYLEAIFLLNSKLGFARVKDIAELMNVSMSTVTNALKRLSEQDLVNYDKYRIATLTENGAHVAQATFRKHQILSDFLQTVLNVDSDKADKNACRIEHTLDEDIIERFVKFIDFVKTCPRAGADWINAFNALCNNNRSPSDCKKCIGSCETSIKGRAAAAKKGFKQTRCSLGNLEVGDEAVISRISSDNTAFHHLAEMGLVMGTKVKTVGKKPGNTIEIRVRGYNISLSLDEASLVEVEKAQ